MIEASRQHLEEGHIVEKKSAANTGCFQLE
jgi:hypothetical protein